LLSALWAQDFNGTLSLFAFEKSTVQVSRDFNGTMSDTQPGSVQQVTIGRSLTASGSLLAGSIDMMTVGLDISGQITTLGNVQTLSVGRSLTYQGNVAVGGNFTTMMVGPNQLAAGDDLAGQVIVT